MIKFSSIFNYRVGNESEAEDLTSQVFEKAYSAIPRYRYMGRPFGVWLFSIEHNLLVDYYRAKHKTASFEDVIIEAGDASDPALQAERSIENASLRHTIMKLNRDQQAVVVMRYISGLEYPEIAAILNKTEGAVRIIMHRSILALRDIMGIKVKLDSSSKDGA